MRDICIVDELTPSTVATVQHFELGTVRRCQITIADEDDHAADDGGDPRQLVMDAQRARELFNWLGAWLHGA